MTDDRVQGKIMALWQIYTAINTATGQVKDGEPLTHGQIEVIGHSLMLFYRTLRELSIEFDIRLADAVEWNEQS